MGQRHGVPVGRLDRHDPSARRDGADERDRAGGRSDDRVSGSGADVNSAVLARRVWIAAQDELLEYWTFHRPGPRSRSRHDHEGRRERDDQGSTHVCLSLLVVLLANDRFATVPGPQAVVNMDYRDVS
jgi:hypothetical protein